MASRSASGSWAKPTAAPAAAAIAANGPQVLLGRLGRVVVPAVGLAAQDDRLAAQGAEELAGQPAPRPVAGVEGDDEPAAADRLDVDDLEHLLEVDLVGIVERARRAEADPRLAQRNSLRLPAVEHGPASAGLEHHAPRLEELQAVVLGRVVRGRDLDAPGRPPLADQDPHRGRGGRPGDRGRRARSR